MADWYEVPGVSLKGAPGEDGVDGAAGAQGPPGADGAQGPQGPQGQPGETGPEGPEGAQGPAGTAFDPEMSVATIDDLPAGDPVGTARMVRGPGQPSEAGPAGHIFVREASGWTDFGQSAYVGPAGPAGGTGPSGPDGAQGPQGVRGTRWTATANPTALTGAAIGDLNLMPDGTVQVYADTAPTG